MIASIFKYLLPHIENNRIKNLRKLLKELGLFEIFSGIDATTPDDWEKISTFVLLGYTPDSSYIISSSDWGTRKREIFEMCGLNEELHADVLNYTHPSVRDAIRAIGEVKNDPRHWQIIVWEETVILLDKIATTKPTFEKNPAKSIADAAKFSYELRKKIRELKEEINKTTRSTERLNEVKEIESDNNSYEKLLKEELRSSRKN